MAAVDELKKKIEELVKNKKIKGRISKARVILDGALAAVPEDNKTLREDILKIYTPKIIKGDAIGEYFITYDAFSEGLEPVYYWFLEFLDGMKYKLKKTQDVFAASEGGGWYSEMGMRRTALEKRASELIGTINMVIKSIINLLWDLKEFDMRLNWYEKYKSKNEKEKEEADLALKAVYLTEVDMKKGRAAINSLAQDLNFITIRDAFMVAKKPEDVDSMDLNDRVKRVLKPRVGDYLKWVELSDKELNERYRIEKAYLKSQVNSMKLYTAWAKPYLIATNKLLPPDITEDLDGIDVDLVTSFDVAKVYLEIFAKKEAELPQTKKTPSWPIEVPEEEKWFSCIEISLNHRTSPSGSATDRGHLIHRGRVIMSFREYIMQKKHITLKDEEAENELLKLVSGLTEETLSAMNEDLKKYVESKPDKDKKDEKKKEFKIPIVETAKEIARPFKEAAEGIKQFFPAKKPKVNSWELKRLEEEAKAKAKKDIFTVYEQYKKQHGMLKW